MILLRTTDPIELELTLFDRAGKASRLKNHRYRYINGHETCTDSISHTNAIIFFPFVMINATIGNIVASTKTQSNDA